MVEQITRFSDAARAALDSQNYLVYPLTGKSIRDLRETGSRFWSVWHKGYNFENLPSRLSEVAFKPEQLFSSDTEIKTLAEQEARLELFKGSNRIPDAEAIVGEASDHVELIVAHLAETGDMLYGEKYGYIGVGTTTRTDSGIVIVSSFNLGSGIRLGSGDRNNKSGRIINPLLVPR